MKAFCANYQSFQSQQNVNQIIEENKNLEVTNVRFAIHPQSLRERLQTDIIFSHHDLKRTSTSSLNMRWNFRKLFKSWKMDPRGRQKIMKGVVLGTLEGTNRTRTRTTVASSLSVCGNLNVKRVLKMFFVTARNFQKTRRSVFAKNCRREGQEGYVEIHTIASR